MLRRAALATAFGVAALLIAAWQYGAIPTYANYFEINEATHQKDCSAYHILLVALLKIGKALHDNGEAVVALGTLAIAGFTYTLWRATDRL